MHPIYEKICKRLLDIFISFIGLVILVIPMIIIAVLIKIDSKGSVLFKQEREGKLRNKITVLKFRTMCEHAYENGGIATSESDNRITKIGKILRRTSLDETPQLINILKGEMSIIGPRPILDWEFDETNNNPKYIRRFDVKPGLFCTVDVEHRNADRDLQFEMDAEYAENCSLKLDISTFFRVIKTVITGKGVYKDEK